MSAHDRGTFGKLLVQLRRFGYTRCTWEALLDADDEDDSRWSCSVLGYIAHGRTGEEALRRLIDAIAQTPEKA